MSKQPEATVVIEEAKLTDISIMRFGKHKGERLIDIPDSYLVWLYHNMDDLDISLCTYIYDSLHAILSIDPDDLDV